MRLTSSAAFAARAAADRGYWFDEKAAAAAAGFFPRYLRFTQGEWAGHPFRLEPWEENDIVRPLFGWKRVDGTRLYRRCYVWVPRKNGKTELAAGIGILIQVGDGEMGGQVFSIASDEDQAKIVFDKASVMVSWSEELQKSLTPFKTSIWCADLMAPFKYLSGVPKGKHGVNMSGLIGDELHEWRDDRLYTFMHQSSASRRQPLEFLISTAGERAGYGWEMWQYCEKILAGEIEDPETLVVIYAADPDDDWTDPATWAKANPNLGVSVKLDYLKAECRKANELPRLENDFKRYHLNIWTEQAVRWIPIEKWDACGLADRETPLAAVPKLAMQNQRWRDLPQAMAGRPAFAGLDLSSTTDLTALVWVFPPEQEGGRWTIVPRFFVPENQIQERVRRDRVPYDQWVAMGAMTATPGNVVDYAFVRRQAFTDAEQFQAKAIAIDRWNATQLATELAAEGLNVMFFGQGFASMSAPCKEYERLILDRRIDHGGHPVLRWCMRNIAITPDPAGNIKPDKAKSTERIDGGVGAIMGLGAAIGEKRDDMDISEFLESGIVLLRAP